MLFKLKASGALEKGSVLAVRSLVRTMWPSLSICSIIVVVQSLASFADVCHENHLFIFDRLNNYIICSEDLSTFRVSCVSICS